uniref:Splicing factor Cactin n=1 Tax=Eptatretus burgeri TaxID=7764 RepID=A0A8C4R183_EPTBU
MVTVRSRSSTDWEYESDSVSERDTRGRRGSGEGRKDERRSVKRERRERGTSGRQMISRGSSRERRRYLRKEECTDDDDDDVRSAREELDERSHGRREKRRIDEVRRSESSRRIPGEVMEVDGETDGSSTGTKSRGRGGRKLARNGEDSSGSERGRRGFQREERRQRRSSSTERRLGKSVRKHGSESSSEGRRRRRKRRKEDGDLGNARRRGERKNRKRRSSGSCRSGTEEEEQMRRQSSREEDDGTRGVSMERITKRGTRRRSPSSSPVCETRRSKLATDEDSTYSNPKKAEEEQMRRHSFREEGDRMRGVSMERITKREVSMERTTKRETRRRSPSSSPVCEARRSKLATDEDSTYLNPQKAEEDRAIVLRQHFSGSRSSSSSSSSGVRSARTSSISAADKKRLKEEQKREREVVKALETPEEKRARRLAKREAKERRRRQRMGWSEEYMGYTNADNPFGDNNLLGTFFWHKVKELRQEREREQSLREQELELLQREKEAEHFKQWEEQEDSFHLQQAKLRSKIRIKDGRAKPIDLLAKYISAEDDDLALEMHEPYSVLAGLALTDLEDLLEDIQVYIELEQEKNVDFWRDMTIITEDELTRLRKLQAELGLGPGDRREGINPSVSGDVQGVFKGKSYGQLQALNAQIENKISSGQALDIGYWESLLQQLRAYMARARLRERHQAVLRQKLFKLKQEQGVASAPLFPIIKTEEEEENTPPDTHKTPSGNTEVKESAESCTEEQSTAVGEEIGDTNSGAAGAESVLTEQDVLEQSMEECEAGGYTPPRLDPTALPSDADIRDPDEDEARLDFVRSRLLATGRADESADEAFERHAREGMCADESRFSVEVPVSDRLYLWSDKYRPRKPRFFNRVHTGFEWNKYNQTHYDFDNPPPKIVQGYKFNIFYPDLIDKKSTPQYFLESCSDNRDFAILRFRAGPPYEDIAFKIVNREWEYSHRHGFRCQFANSIFQLWFHFKRFRYRR